MNPLMMTLAYRWPVQTLRRGRTSCSSPNATSAPLLPRASRNEAAALAALAIRRRRSIMDRAHRSSVGAEAAQCQPLLMCSQAPNLARMPS